MNDRYFALGCILAHCMLLFLVCITADKIVKAFKWVSILFGRLFRRPCHVDWMDDHDVRTCSYCSFRRRKIKLPKAKLLKR